MQDMSFIHIKCTKLKPTQETPKIGVNLECVMDVLLCKWKDEYNRAKWVCFKLILTMHSLLINKAAFISQC